MKMSPEVMKNVTFRPFLKISVTWDYFLIWVLLFEPLCNYNWVIKFFRRNLYDLWLYQFWKINILAGNDFRPKLRRILKKHGFFLGNFSRECLEGDHIRSQMSLADFKPLRITFSLIPSFWHFFLKTKESSV